MAIENEIPDEQIEDLTVTEYETVSLQAMGARLS